MRNAATTGKRIGYGWLYNWPAVNHANGLAPDGWRIPTDAEWTAMRGYLITTYGHIEIGNVGGALKSTRNEWDSPNLGATDEFGFAALPGGRRLKAGGFENIRGSGFWWSSTVHAARQLISTSDSIYSPSFVVEVGGSIRCIQDKAGGESDGDTGYVTDIDGNLYKWIVIGDHRWMTENLRTTKYKNGDVIPEITDNTDWGNDTTGARCAYDNDHYYVYPPLK